MKDLDLAYLAPFALLVVCGLAAVAFTGWLLISHKAPVPVRCVCDCDDTPTIPIEPLNGTEEYYDR